MAWKIEKWLSDIFPGYAKIYSAYHELTARELALVGSGVLDSALAELISMRVKDIPSEYESFLGVDGSTYAPSGSFGARIQLAVLLGIITLEDAHIFRLMKNIRNKFAHQINVGFCHPSVSPLIKKLYLAWRTQSFFLARKNDWNLSLVEEGLSEIENSLNVAPEAGEGLFLTVFTVYQAYLHRLSEKITRIADICI